MKCIEIPFGIVISCGCLERKHYILLTVERCCNDKAGALGAADSPTISKVKLLG
jgi:hypothetical protein